MFGLELLALGTLGTSMAAGNGLTEEPPGWDMGRG
jgi:hypothetical protein